MNIHPTLAAAASSLSVFGFSVSSYSATPDGSPSRRVALGKTVPVVELPVPVVSLCIDLSLRADETITATATAVIGMMTLTTSELSFPHPRLPEILDCLARCAVASAHEFYGRCDREYFGILLTQIDRAIAAGRLERARAFVRSGLETLPVNDVPAAPADQERRGDLHRLDRDSHKYVLPTGSNL